MGLDAQEMVALGGEVAGLAAQIKQALEDGKADFAEVMALLAAVAKLAAHVARDVRD